MWRSLNRRGSLIYQHILQLANTTPDRVAIRRNGLDLSYRCFADAILLARGELLEQQLVRPGVVGVAIVDLQEFWITALALRSLGATTLAIRSPDVLPELIHSGIASVVGDETWAELWDACHQLHLRLSPAPSRLGVPPNSAGPPPLDGGHILLSSGTTCRSKMVLYNSPADEVAIGQSLSTDANTMYHVFDYGPWTVAGYLIATHVWAKGGGIIIDQDAKWREVLRDLSGTHAGLLPAFLSEILAAPEGSFPRNENLHVFVGGGTITATEISDAKRRISPHIYNWLGSTEVGMIACTPLEEPDDHRWHRIDPTRVVEIVDELGQAVPIGQVGSLRVAVSDGPSKYYNDPEATAAFFRDGYFYPGDLAAARGDGRIALQGRTTEVINIKGTKFALAPFEDHLREVFDFTGVCLFSMQDDDGQEQLNLVVESTQPLPPHLLELLQRKFPIVPLRVFTVAALPRTSTGKIIRTDVQAGVLAASNSNVSGHQLGVAS